MRKQIWFVVLLCVLHVNAIIKGKVENLSKTVSAKTSIKIDFDSWAGFSILKANSKVDVVFPEDDFWEYFNTFNGVTTTLSSDLCYQDYGYQNGEVLTCVVKPNSRTVTVSASNDSLYSSLGFFIGGVINPESAMTTGKFTIEIIDPSGTLIDSSTSYDLTVEADTLKAATLVNTNDFVGEYGKLQVSLTTKNQVDMGTNVVLVFPKWDQDSDDTTKYYSYLQNDTCSLDTSDSTLTNVDSGAICEFKNLNSSFDQVTIKNAYSADIGADYNIKFVISSVRNAPSTRGVDGIMIYTAVAGSGNRVDQKGNLTFAPLKACPAPNSNFQLDLSNSKVATMTDMNLRIKIHNPAPKGSTLKVVFPPEVKIGDSTGSQIYLKTIEKLNRGSKNLQFVLSSSKSSSQKDTVVIQDAFPDYLTQDSVVFLQFSQILTPITSAETGFFKFQLFETYNGGSYLIEENNGVFLRTSAQPLTNFEFYTNNNTVFAPIEASVDVRFTGVMKKNTIVELNYPSDMQLLKNLTTTALTNITSCTINFLGKDFTPTCQLDATQRNITMQSFLTADQDFSKIANGEKITFSVNGVFINPWSEKPIDVSFNVKLKDGDGHVVAYFDPSNFTTDYTYSAKAVEIDKFEIGAINQYTGQTSKLALNLTIPDGQQLQSGSYMEIQIPSQVSLVAPISCEKGVGLDFSPVCSSNSSDSILVDLGTQASSIVGPTKVQFFINSVKNPPSTKPTDSFIATIKTQDNYAVVRQSKSMTLQVSLGSKFTKVDISRGSDINGDETQYEFNITLSNQIESGSILIVEPPSQLTIAAQLGTYVDCAGVGLIQSSLSCILVKNQVLVTLNFVQGTSVIQAGQNIGIIIYNVKNPRSLSESDSFKLYMKTDDLTYSINTQTDGMTVVNTQAALLTSAEVSATDPTLGVDSDYKFSIMPNNAFTVNAIIEVTMPDTLLRSNQTLLSCQGDQNLNKDLKCSYDSQLHKVTIQSAISRNQAQPILTVFNISGFTNPETPSFEQSFQIETFDQNKKLIDYMRDGLSITQECDYPCATCGLSKKTCLSCRLDQTFKYLFNSTCLDECPNGQYADKNFVCQKCSDECKTCSNSGTFCTQCSNPYDFLYAINGKCVSTCPDGQFTDKNSGVCLDCNKNCKTCRSIDSCNTCADGLVRFSNGTCSETCPISMIPSKDGLTCVECQAPCKQCKETVDQCTSCDLNSQFPYLYGFKCVKECPSGYAPMVSDGQTCELIKEDVVPFVFLILALIVAMAIGVAKLFRKKLQFKNTLIAIITVVCQASWIFLLYLTVKDNMWQSSVVLAYALASSYILNLIFFCLYIKVMRQDEYYMRWRSERVKRETTLVIFALLTSFQLYRIALQQLSKTIKLIQEEEDQKQRDIERDEAEDLDKSEHEGGDQDGIEEKLYKYADGETIKGIFNKLTIIMISAVLFPVLVQNIYNLHFTHPGRQLFYTDIESIAITTFLLFTMAYDSYKKTKKIDMKNIKTKQSNAQAKLRSNAQITAGIPNDLSGNDNSSNPAEFDQIRSLFKSTQDMKKLRDILNVMINNSDQRDSRLKGATRLNLNAVVDDDNTKNNIFGQARKSNRQDITGIKNDTTVLSAYTDDNFIGTDRNLITKRRTNQLDKADRQYISPHVKNEAITANENISGDISGDENRDNIHGQTDSQVFKEFDIDQTPPVKKSVGAIENIRDSNNMLQRRDLHGGSQNIPKGVLSKRLENEILKSQITDQSPSALRDSSNVPGPKGLANELSTYKSVPNHFSIVSKDVSEPNMHDESLEQREGGHQITVDSMRNSMTMNDLSNALGPFENFQADQNVHTNRTSKFRSLVSVSDPKLKRYNDGDVSVIDERAEVQEHTPNPSQRDELSKSIVAAKEIIEEKLDKNVITVNSSKLTVDQKSMKKPLDAVDTMQFNLNIYPVDYVSKCSRSPSPDKRDRTLSQNNHSSLDNYTNDDIKMLNQNIQQQFDLEKEKRKNHRLESLIEKEYPMEKKMMKTQNVIDMRNTDYKVENGAERPATADDMLGGGEYKDLAKHQVNMDVKWVSQFEKQSSIEKSQAGKTLNNEFQGTFIEHEKTDSKDFEKLEWYDKIMKQRTSVKRQASMASSAARSFSPGKSKITGLNLPLVRPKDVAANYDHELLQNLGIQLKDAREITLGSVSARERSLSNGKHMARHMVNKLSEDMTAAERRINNQLTLMSSGKDKLSGKFRLDMPAMSQRSGEAPPIDIRARNSQEKQYLQKIISKDLMSPDLKLADINRGIVHQSIRSKSSGSKTFSNRKRLKPRASRDRENKSMSNDYMLTEREQPKQSTREETTPIKNALNMVRDRKEIMTSIKTEKIQERVLSARSNKVIPKAPRAYALDVNSSQYVHLQKQRQDYLQEQLQQVGNNPLVLGSFDIGSNRGSKTARDGTSNAGRYYNDAKSQYSNGSNRKRFLHNKSTHLVGQEIITSARQSNHSAFGNSDGFKKFHGGDSENQKSMSKHPTLQQMIKMEEDVFIKSNGFENMSSQKKNFNEN